MKRVRVPDTELPPAFTSVPSTRRIPRALPTTLRNLSALLLRGSRVALLHPSSAFPVRVQYPSPAPNESNTPTTVECM